MQPTELAHFHLDNPAADGAALRAGPIRLRGWAFGRDGCFITDLRVRTGAALSPAFYGHPRPDVARYLSIARDLLPAGFEVELHLVPGDNVLEFELCDAAGIWRPLSTHMLIAVSQPDAPAVASDHTIQPHEFARALRLVLQRSVHEPIAKAARDVADLLPIPLVTRYPTVPFHGHLHQPAALQRADFGRLFVEGWLFHENVRIRRVACSVDLQAWTMLSHGDEQPFVAQLHPHFPRALHSRVAGCIDVPAHLPQPLSVRLFAELADGTWHLCHVQRCHVYDEETNKAPYGRFNPIKFVRAASDLWRACARRGLDTPLRRPFFGALGDAWHEYRARAGISLSGPAATTPRTAVTAPPAHVLLATHNLNYEGAPLFLLELARYLHDQGSRLTVVSGAEGPLCAAFEQFAESVTVVDAGPSLKARNAATLDRSLPALAAPARLASADLVIANTLSAWWAIHLAARAGRRSLLYIHESTTPDAFFQGHAANGILPSIKHTFSLATHISFLTEATRRYYHPVLRRSNHSINSGWIDLERIHAHRAARSRTELRAALRLAPETRLVINVGAVCERKGQHMFARAVDLLWRRQPALAATAEFLMVGGRGTPFDEHVGDLVAQLQRRNLRLVDETPAPYDYYGAADIFVASSYEESFPRVILEAMGFALPIVSTAVHGVPEMTRDGREARLVLPGDPSALADAMAALLSDTGEAQRLAANAARRVAAEYTSRQLQPVHAALASAVAAGRLDR